MTITRARITLLIIMAMALLAMSGCLFSPPEKTDDDDTTVEFGSYDTPDGLVDNFVLAWENMVLEEYRDQILYNGEELTLDGSAYEQFKFYFIADSYEDPFWGYGSEVDHTQALFSGDPGENDTPGVESIELSLNPFSDWSDYTGATVEGDPAPTGCKGKTYYTNMTIQLKGTFGDDITAFLVDDMIRFYVIPVDVNGTTEYRLWKWLDVAND